MRIYFAKHGYHIPTERVMKENGARRLVSYVDDQLPLILRYHASSNPPEPARRTAKMKPKEDVPCL
jgi:hypothetical protein